MIFFVVFSSILLLYVQVVGFANLFCRGATGSNDGRQASKRGSDEEGKTGGRTRVGGDECVRMCAVMTIIIQICKNVLFDAGENESEVLLL